MCKCNEFSNDITIITSPAGTGKSTLSELFQRRYRAKHLVDGYYGQELNKSTLALTDIEAEKLPTHIKGRPIVIKTLKQALTDLGVSV